MSEFWFVMIVLCAVWFSMVGETEWEKVPRLRLILSVSTSVHVAVYCGKNNENSLDETYNKTRPRSSADNCPITPRAAKYPGQGASSSYCQGDTESGNFPGRSKYVGCYHGGVEKETLERCQKECDTKTWIPPFIKKTSCWGRVADNYNHQRSGKKSLQEAITEMEGVCGECRNEQQ